MRELLYGCAFQKRMDDDIHRKIIHDDSFHNLHE